MLSRLSEVVSELTSDPIFFLLKIWAILFSLICHEVAHGYVAKKCGDPTAQMFGRLSFNPLKHLDPFGTVCMIFFGFGWAKPVPVNPRNFRKFRRDDMLVSLAGITANLILYLCARVLFFGLYAAFGYGSVIQAIGKILVYLASINISLAVFNLLPIPPLDGYHVVNDLILKGRFHPSGEVMRWLKIALLVVCFCTSWITGLMSTIISFVDGGVCDLLQAIFF